MAAAVDSTHPPGLQIPNVRPSSWPIRNLRRHAATAAFNSEVMQKLDLLSQKLDHVLAGIPNAAEDRLSRLETLLVCSPSVDEVLQELMSKRTNDLHVTSNGSSVMQKLKSERYSHISEVSDFDARDKYDDSDFRIPTCGKWEALLPEQLASDYSDSAKGCLFFDISECDTNMSFQCPSSQISTLGEQTESMHTDTFVDSIGDSLVDVYEGGCFLSRDVLDEVIKTRSTMTYNEYLRLHPQQTFATMFDPKRSRDIRREEVIFLKSVSGEDARVAISDLQNGKWSWGLIPSRSLHMARKAVEPDDT